MTLLQEAAKTAAAAAETAVARISRRDALLMIPGASAGLAAAERPKTDGKAEISPAMTRIWDITIPDPGDTRPQLERVGGTDFVYTIGDGGLQIYNPGGPFRTIMPMARDFDAKTHGRTNEIMFSRVWNDDPGDSLFWGIYDTKLGRGSGYFRITRVGQNPECINILLGETAQREQTRAFICTMQVPEGNRWAYYGVQNPYTADLLASKLPEFTEKASENIQEMDGFRFKKDDKGQLQIEAIPYTQQTRTALEIKLNDSALTGQKALEMLTEIASKSGATPEFEKYLRKKTKEYLRNENGASSPEADKVDEVIRDILRAQYIPSIQRQLVNILNLPPKHKKIILDGLKADLARLGGTGSDLDTLDAENPSNDDIFSAAVELGAFIDIDPFMFSNIPILSLGPNPSNVRAVSDNTDPSKVYITSQSENRYQPSMPNVFVTDATFTSEDGYPDLAVNQFCSYVEDPEIPTSNAQISPDPAGGAFLMYRRTDGSLHEARALLRSGDPFPATWNRPVTESGGDIHALSSDSFGRQHVAEIQTASSGNPELVLHIPKNQQYYNTDAQYFTLRFGLPRDGISIYKSLSLVQDGRNIYAVVGYITDQGVYRLSKYGLDISSTLSSLWLSLIQR